CHRHDHAHVRSNAMLTVTCPHCGHGGKTSDSVHGLTLRCPQCHSLFLLRFDPIADSALQTEPSQEDRGAADPATGTTVLVVADDEIACNGLATVLRNAGYGITTAGSGREALEQLQAGPTPALVLMD